VLESLLLDVLATTVQSVTTCRVATKSCLQYFHDPNIHLSKIYGSVVRKHTYTLSASYTLNLLDDHDFSTRVTSGRCNVCCGWCDCQICRENIDFGAAQNIQYLE
jgi:hypothetical protein